MAIENVVYYSIVIRVYYFKMFGDSKGRKCSGYSYHNFHDNFIKPDDPLELT